MIILTDHEGEKFDLYFDFAETWWIKHISTSLLNHLLTISEWSEVPQSCPTLCDPMDCSLSGSSIHGIFQARVLEWIAISFSRGSSWPRNWTRVSCIAGRCFTIWATREAPKNKHLFAIRYSTFLLRKEVWSSLH